MKGQVFAMMMIPGLVLAAAPDGPEGAPWPTAGWATATPEELGLDASVLAKLDAELSRGDHGYVDGLLVIRRGRIVFERSYKHDYDALFRTAPDRKPGPYNYYDSEWYPWEHRGDLHTMQSVSKSVTSALVGVAIQRRDLPGVGAKALPYFDGYKVSADPRRDRWTIENLLTMTSGIRWDEDTLPYTDPGNSCARMESSADWVQFVLDQPMVRDPGSMFVYDSGVTVLLAQVLKKATGIQADVYAREHLFGPLGITHFSWKHTPTGIPDAEGGLYLTARDLAKIGYLYLRDGVWDGKRILPESWVAASTAAHMDATSDEAGFWYGYQWWRASGGPTPAFAAIGYGGQFLFVAPDLDLIAVFTGWNIYDRPELSPRDALERVLAAVTKR